MMQERRQVSERSVSFFYLACLACALAPWIFIHLNYIPNADIVWLVEAARRYFHGDTMAGGFYEPNPPLALWVSAPVFLMARLASISVATAIFLFTSILTALSAASLWFIIAPWAFLKRTDKLALVFSYVLANTVLCGPMFGERDHLLALGLVPFVFMQIALTFGLPHDRRLARIVFFAGAWLILLKPAHGLLVTLLLLYRGARRRDLSFVRDADFIALAAVTAAYATGTILLFPDYVHLILPDVVKFYIATAHWSATAKLALEFSFSALVLLILTARLPVPARDKYLPLFLAGAALLSLVPFVVQGRGFYYQLIPAMVFLWLALGLWLNHFAGREMAAGPAGILTVALMTVLTYSTASNPMHPTRTEYARLPLVRLAAGCGQPPCNVFIFAPNLEIGQETAYAARAFSASRFPSFWFLSELLNQQDLLARGLPATMARHRFATMVAEDLNRYRPPLVMIARFDILFGQPFDFPGYFSFDATFADAWAPYRKDDSIVVRPLDYVPDSIYPPGQTVTFDIYRRSGP